MAKLPITVFLFVLAFPVAFSRPENDVIVADQVAAAEPDPPRSDPGSGSLASDETNVPVNFINFHPINRHFPRRPLMATKRLNRWRHKQDPGFEIRYGRDMVMPGGRDADRWPLGVVRQIPATHDSYDEDRVKDVEKDQIDMLYGQGTVTSVETGDFPEKIWEEEKVDENNMKMDDCGEVLMARSRIYPEEKVRIKKIKMMKLRHNGKKYDDKEYKGLFMNKVRKFLTDLV
ncbi:PREDICTED: uncharacterized protein LOC104804942 [Tarenaya hassleriana]|uniref:uncharacterized protein LOC104804942 n=1 Tax=Tarenaya hassleriana TaxID=28532 RepID=UPI00053C0CD4|nr:PREDICTED: uncharacterized protein LOC104804942 [Tarenaya hassleriana]